MPNVTEIMTTPEILNAQRRLAEAVNSDIKLPVPWRSLKSAGFKTTVCHVQLEAGLQSGNLRRRRGDLLCGAKLSSVELAEACDSAGQPYMQEISCKACLDRAEVFNRIVRL